MCNPRERQTRSIPYTPFACATSLLQSSCGFSRSMSPLSFGLHQSQRRPSTVLLETVSMSASFRNSYHIYSSMKIDLFIPKTFYPSTTIHLTSTPPPSEQRAQPTLRRRGRLRRFWSCLFYLRLLRWFLLLCSDLNFHCLRLSRTRLGRRNGDGCRSRRRRLPSTLQKPIHIQLDIVECNVEEQGFLVVLGVSSHRTAIVSEPVPLISCTVSGDGGFDLLNVVPFDGEEFRVSVCYILGVGKGKR